MRIEQCNVRVETWPLRNPFRIARGVKTEASVVTVELKSGPHVGRGECCPYARYGETVERILSTLKTIDLNALGSADPCGMRLDLLKRLPAGSARNALDCALWDLEAKSRDLPVWQLANLPEPQPQITCFTLSLDTPDAMAAQASKHLDCPLLKLKLGDASLDRERIEAVRHTRADARLVCDANEGWRAKDMAYMADAAHSANLELIEQPLPAASDAALRDLKPTIPVCADESAAPGITVAELQGRYQAINIKLDKTGGLTNAITVIEEARHLGFKIMIGSMVSSSLSMAPAALLGSRTDWIDLDSPMLLDKDHPFAMTIDNGYLSPPSSDLWG